MLKKIFITCFLIAGFFVVSPELRAQTGGNE
jgi:hypothetical protein